MFSTGFNGDCETEPAQGLKAMQEIARERECAVAGSIAVELQNGAKVNRFYFVTPDSVQYYDKKHLFTYSGEHRKFTGGDSRVVVEWKGVRILLLVCYDLRFPVWSNLLNRKLAFKLWNAAKLLQIYSILFNYCYYAMYFFFLKPDW